MLKQANSGVEPASVIAMKLLTYIAGDSDVLGRFLGLTGLGPDDLRDGLYDATFLAGVLDFALQDESLLVAFAATEGLNPLSIMQARSKLPGFSP